MNLRFVSTALLLLASTWVPPAHAARAEADSSRFLPRWLHGFVEAGPGWMQKPTNVRRRYTVGLSGALGLEVEPASRVRVMLRADYVDLPLGTGSYGGVYDSSGATPVYRINSIGRGHVASGLATVALRVRGGISLEGGGGWGYFESGLPAVNFVDGATGQLMHAPGETGWGAITTAGLRYEFTPNGRDHLVLSARWFAIERDGVRLDFVPIRVGYRYE